MRLRFGIVLLALACGGLAACANTTGGGSTMPAGQLPQVQAPATPSGAPTATPASAQGLIRVTPATAIPLNAPGDFKVSAIWPAAGGSASPASSASPPGSASPAPSASATPASTASPITLNATVSVPGPPSIPAYGVTHKKSFLLSHRELGPVLLYVWFSSDKAVKIASLPTLDFTIPLTALEPYGTDPELKLALYDPANEGKWTEGIARSVAMTPEPSPSATATPSETATPTATPTPTASPTATPSRPPGAPMLPTSPTPSTRPSFGVAAATARPPVQTMKVRFVPEERAMKLLAKKNLVFVLYAQPTETDTPTPSPSGKSTGAASASASASPSASASAAPSPSATMSASPTPAPSGS